MKVRDCFKHIQIPATKGYGHDPRRFMRLSNDNMGAERYVITEKDYTETNILEINCDEHFKAVPLQQGDVIAGKGLYSTHTWRLVLDAPKEELLYPPGYWVFRPTGDVPSVWLLACYLMRGRRAWDHGITFNKLSLKCILDEPVTDYLEEEVKLLMGILGTTENLRAAVAEQSRLLGLMNKGFLQQFAMGNTIKSSAKEMAKTI